MTATYTEATELDAIDAIDPYDVPPAVSPDTIIEVLEEIETNTWLAAQYEAQGAYGLAGECIRAAFNTWRAYCDLIDPVHPGLRNRIVCSAVRYKVPGAAAALMVW